MFCEENSQKAESNIEEKLGNGFTRAPFVVVVVSSFFYYYKMCKINPGIF
jgi:hypothetical protein